MDKEYGIEDLLHTAKELEKWQKKDVPTINMNNEERASDVYDRRRGDEEYRRYRDGQCCN